LKTDFLDGALALNTAIFYTDYSSFQLNTFNGAFFTINNVNEVISQGAEAEVFWNIANGVVFTGGATYADSRYGDDAGFINNGSAPSGVTVLDDQRITHAPYWQGSAALLVNRPLPGTRLNYQANVNYSFRGNHNTS
jgi:outer membrane receptor protein involved in Fe transport